MVARGRSGNSAGVPVHAGGGVLPAGVDRARAAPPLRADRRGCCLGVGLWIKPTMGAFIFGMGLLLLLDLVRVGFDFAPLAATPCSRADHRNRRAAVGRRLVPAQSAAWGMPPLVFPPAFWQTLAQRSGGEFGWLLAALIAWAVFLVARYPRHDWRIGRAGLALVLLALLPSILSPRRLTCDRVRAAWRGRGRCWRSRCGGRRVICGMTICARSAAKVGLGAGAGAALLRDVVLLLQLSLPPVVRHRPAADPADGGRAGAPVHAGADRRRRCGGSPIFADRRADRLFRASIAAVSDLNGGGDYLWTDKYPDDTARYRSGNAALMNVVDGLNIWHRRSIPARSWSSPRRIWIGCRSSSRCRTSA